MPNKILFPVGPKSRLPLLEHKQIAYCADTNELYIGVRGVGNVLINTLEESGTDPGEIVWEDEPGIPGQFMALALHTAPFVDVFERDTNRWNKHDQLSELPLSVAWGVALSHDNLYLAVAFSTTAPFLRIWKNIDGSFKKVSDVLGAVPGHARSLKFSPDGKYLACAFDTTPFFRVWFHDRKNNLFHALPNPASIPLSAGWGIDFSHDSKHVAVGWITTQPCFGVWKIFENSLIKLDTSHLGDMPGAVGDVQYSQNGVDLVLSHDTYPGFTNIKRDGDYYYRVQGAMHLPAGNGRGTRISDDGQTIVGAWSSFPYVGIFRRIKDAYTMKSRETQITGGTFGYRCSITNDGIYIAITTDWASGRLLIFKRGDDGAYRVLQSPNGPNITLPGTGRGCAFSPDGKLLIIGCDAAPYMFIFLRVGDVFTQLPNPTDMPANPMHIIEWTDDGQYFAIGGQGTAAATNPRLSVYKCIKDDQSEGGYRISRLPLPAAALPQNCNNLAWGPYIPELGYRFLCCVWPTTANYTRLYKFENEILTHVDGFNSWPPGDSYSCRFSPDGDHLIISHNNTATSGQYYLSSWWRNGTSWIKTDNLTAFLNNAASYTSTAWSMLFTPDGKYLIIGGIENPTMFRRRGNMYLRVNKPVMSTTGGINGMAMSQDGNVLVAAHSTLPLIAIWERTYDGFIPIGFPGRYPPVDPAASGTRHNVALIKPDASEFAVGFNQGAFMDIYRKGSAAFWEHPLPWNVTNAIVRGVAMTHDGTYAATCGHSGPTIWVYKKDSTGFYHRLNVVGIVITTIGVWSLSFTEDGEYLAAGMNTAPWITVFKRYNVDGVEFYEQLPNFFSLPTSVVRGVAFSPDGRYLLVTTHTDNVTIIYKRNGDTFDRLPPLVQPPNGKGYSAAWAPDMKHFAIGTDTAPYIIVYNVDIETETFTRMIDPDVACPYYGKGIAFSSDSQRIAVSVHTSPYVVMFWFHNGRLRRVSDIDSALAGVGNSVTFSPIDDMIAVGHNTEPWLTILKPGYHSFRKLPDPDAPPIGLVNKVAYSPDGELIAVGSSTAPYLFIYGISGEIITKSYDPDVMPTGSVLSVTWSKDGRYLAIALNASPYVIVYIRYGTVLQKISNPDIISTAIAYGVAFSPDGKHLCVTYNLAAASRPVRIYSLIENVLTDTMQPDGSNQAVGACYRCEYSADGVYLYAGCATSPFYWMAIRNGDVYTRSYQLNVNPGAVSYGGAFSHDVKYFAYVCNADPWIRVFKHLPNIDNYRWHYNYSAAGNQPTGLPTANNAEYCAFSPDGKFLAFVGSAPYLRIWERENDRWIQMPMPLGIPNVCYGIAWSPDSKTLAIGCASAPFVIFFRLEKMAYQKAMHPFPLPISHVEDVAFTKDGKMLMYGEDGSSTFRNYFGIFDYVPDEGYDRITGPDEDISGGVNAIALNVYEPKEP